MNEQQQQRLRQLPKVDKLLADERIVAQMDGQPRRVVVAAVQQAIEEARQRVLAGTAEVVTTESVVARVLALIEEQSRPTPRRVINATGIIVN
ncbi:MAG: hypothetical protein NZT92_04960, partial [Abditibacteriales bacterium]|nr:hypothetical protein [Abditibacteriales bacterium]MDW8365309.1 hypothetical protein [Abditibacteriales bacterium]